MDSLEGVESSSLRTHLDLGAVSQSLQPLVVCDSSPVLRIVPQMSPRPGDPALPKSGLTTRGGGRGGEPYEPLELRQLFLRSLLETVP